MRGETIAFSSENPSKTAEKKSRNILLAGATKTVDKSLENSTEIT